MSIRQRACHLIQWWAGSKLLSSLTFLFGKVRTQLHHNVLPIITSNNTPCTLHPHRFCQLQAYKEVSLTVTLLIVSLVRVTIQGPSLAEETGLNHCVREARLLCVHCMVEPKFSRNYPIRCAQFLAQSLIPCPPLC